MKKKVKGSPRGRSMRLKAAPGARGDSYFLAKSLPGEGLLSGERNKARSRVTEIMDYDTRDVSDDIGKPIRFEDIGLKLPEMAPTQVVSIRLPTVLLNEIKAICSERDIPYQGWIKWCMSEAVRRAKAA